MERTKEIIIFKSFVKVIIEGNEIFIKSINKDAIKNDLIKRGALGVTFKIERIKDETEVRIPRLHKTDSPEKMMERYFEFTKSQTKGLNIKKLKRLAELALKGNL